MMATFAVTPGPDLSQPWSRLLVACSLSLLLHLAVLLGIPLNPTGGVPNIVSTIYARLEPATPEPPVQAATLVPADQTAAAVNAEVQPKPAEPKAEPKPASAPVSSPSSGIDVPFIRDPTWYTPKQLDVYPQPLTPIRLDYPDAAAAQRLDGKLSLLLLIDEFGVVNEASVIDAQPPGYFEEATLAVFRAMRFSPAQKQGHPVKSRLQLQVKYLYGDSVGAVR